MVHPFVKNGTFRYSSFRKLKMSAPNIASGTEPRRMMNGSRKLLNWAASTRKISTNAEEKCGQKFVALDA